MTHDVQYWCFNEPMLASALRDWASDTRHADMSEQACKDRFQVISDFLYSRQSRDNKLLKGFDLSINSTDAKAE